MYHDCDSTRVDGRMQDSKELRSKFFVEQGKGQGGVKLSSSASHAFVCDQTRVTHMKKARSSNGSSDDKEAFRVVLCIVLEYYNRLSDCYLDPVRLMSLPGRIVRLPGRT
jgi:hypothetical protein